MTTMPGPVKKYLTIGLIVCVVIAASFFFRALSSVKPDVTQPLAFNHKVHIEVAGLNCKDCHLNVEKMAVATIPSIEVCQTCHNDEPISKSPAEKEVLRYVSEKKEIPWAQIYSVPDHVYFSHRRHVARGGLDCSVCHSNMATSTTSVSFQAIPVKMATCMGCHRQNKITTDCLACHK